MPSRSLSHSRKCLTFLACTSFLLSSKAQASTGAKYVSLRRQSHCDRKLTYTELQSNPFVYSGRVLELRGTVGGMIESDSGLSIMLNLPDKNAVTLDIPRNEIAELKQYDTPNLRVLVKVGESSGNVAPLLVLALAHESAVNTLETQAAERAKQADINTEKKRQAEARLRIQASASAARSVRLGPAPAMASRGGGSRRGSLGGASLQQLAAYYEPYLSGRARGLFVPYCDFIANHNRKLSANEAGSITYHLIHFADQNNVDPRLIVAMIIAESDFDPTCTSRTGAAGLGQLMPGTARSLGINNPYDHVQNLDGSIRYLRERLVSFADRGQPGGGMSWEQVSLALAAYNAGPGAVKKHNGIPPYRETQAYVRRVISLYKQLIGA